MDVFLSRLRITILTVFAVVCLCVGTVWAETDLTGAATLNKAGEYYRLTEDITASGTAFTITASGVTLDLNGHTVTYNTSSGTNYGVLISASSATVKNGIIIEGGGSGYMPNGIEISSGSGHDIHHLIIRVTGDRVRGVKSGASDSSFHHIFVNNQGTTSHIASAPDSLTLWGSGGIEVYENVLVGAHRGIDYGPSSGSHRRSDIYNNLVQHTRTGGTKSPYGIVLGKCQNIHVYGNQIISDDGRGITLDGLGQGSAYGAKYNSIYENRIDVNYLIPAGSGAYVEDNVYGIRTRYGSGDNTYERNIIMVDNDVNGWNFGFYIGSDAIEETMKNLVVRDNTIIARDQGSKSRGAGAYVFVWDWAKEIICSNNKYFTDGNLQGDHGDDRVSSMTFTGNTEITPESYTPLAPTGLYITKFLDSYLLRWDDNMDVHGESQTYEYIVYRDGEKLDISPRGGTFYVDIDVGGTHTYSISALTLSGNEGPRCPEVSTTSAKIGWWGGSPPTPPSSLRIIN